MPQHTDPHSDKIDWTAIADKLNRVPMNCNMKWNLVRVTRMKKGRFTAEEDALIRKRALEWGDTGNGLWASLENECLGRAAKHIFQRWSKTLCVRRS